MEKNKKWIILAVVQFANLLAAIDSTIVNIALPAIAKDTNAGLDSIHWIVTVYFIGMCVSMLICGRIGDIYGRSRIFSLGFVLFTLASTLCGAAPDVATLVAARAAQALGGACLLANGSAITSEIFSGSERGFALGLNSTVVAAGYSLGYVLGGVLTEWVGWRAIFLVNLPLGLGAILLCRGVLSSTPVAAANAGGDKVRIGWGSTLLFMVGLGAVLYGLDRIGVQRSLSLANAASLGGGVMALLAFGLTQLRSNQPLLPLSLFAIRSFSVGLVAILLFCQVLATCSFLMPFYLQGIFATPAAETGIILAPYSLAMCLIAPYSGWLSGRINASRLMLGGYLLASLVIGFYAGFDAGTPVLVVAGGQLMLGVAAATFFSPNRVTIFSSVPVHHLGIASGTMQIVRFLGFTLGTTTATVLLQVLMEPLGGLAALLASHGASPELKLAFLRAQSEAFLMMDAALLGGTLLCGWNARQAGRCNA